MTTQLSPATGNRPTHRAYYVTGDGDHRRWHELGPLWAHKDGNGFTFVPSVLPAPGEPITIRVIKQPDATEPVTPQPAAE